MDMGNLISRVEETGSELRARALRCESVDKLVELAEENSIELTKEEAGPHGRLLRGLEDRGSHGWPEDCRDAGDPGENQRSQVAQKERHH